MGKKHASQYANFGWLPVVKVCEVLKHERQTLVNVFSIYTAPPPPGGFLRKSPLQMYKKISLVRQL